MPVEVLWCAGLRERFQFEVDDSPPGDVESREVLRGGERLRSYRLADEPSALEVRVSARGAELIGPAVGLGDESARVALSMPALGELGRLLAAWLGARGELAAYVGRGERLRGPAPYAGYVPLTWYRAGSRSGQRVDEHDKRLGELRMAARGIRFMGERRLGGHVVDRQLQSGLDELVGVVLRGPGSLVSVLGRGAAAVGADEGAAVDVGRWLAMGGIGSELGGVGGVLVRPDAVEVVRGASVVVCA